MSQCCPLILQGLTNKQRYVMIRVPLPKNIELEAAAVYPLLGIKSHPMNDKRLPKETYYPLFLRGQVVSFVQEYLVPDDWSASNPEYADLKIPPTEGVFMGAVKYVDDGLPIIILLYYPVMVSKHICLLYNV